jgi:hypothetical protein
VKQIIKIPFFQNRYFYVNFWGLELTERKKGCQKHLENFVKKYSEDDTKKEVVEKSPKNEPEAEIDTEWPIFKKIRLFLSDDKEDDK